MADDVETLWEMRKNDVKLKKKIHWGNFLGLLRKQSASQDWEELGRCILRISALEHTSRAVDVNIAGNELLRCNSNDIEAIWIIWIKPRSGSW